MKNKLPSLLVLVAAVTAALAHPGGGIVVLDDGASSSTTPAFPGDRASAASISPVAPRRSSASWKADAD
ncbi:MAG TPA: hypothetical protein VFO11_02550 [Candidatus Polarisedimenticolaceae bacterium]|nr:hypothetical protein [Candidatus Polarisedimenticolaceae bacterium]